MDARPTGRGGAVGGPEQRREGVVCVAVGPVGDLVDSPVFDARSARSVDARLVSTSVSACWR
ncbi:hypothetical protein [Halorientalis sp.]|uniref:hypothetical protein n=1 Tax=Halorientalis sp. TaxID=1931229 RepID=UPI0026200991|nr:hypothetical protein [Halorientalis sp.]